MKKYISLVLIIFVLSGLIYCLRFYTLQRSRGVGTNLPVSNEAQKDVLSTNSIDIADQDQSVIGEPISDALSRITKKPFGIKISPKDSPIQPEKFSGYHTGIDFETTSIEQNIDIPIYAVCSGPLILQKRAGGYGGVAVQSCTIDKQAVTVVYGHLRLASITAKIGQELNRGEQIGFLGSGFSVETDGERKHLHLSIHKGTGVNILGYVQKPEHLSAWINPADLLK
ncbi:MAG: M23 family metallopeptidase [Patescibacteria group bacterium]